MFEVALEESEGDLGKETEENCMVCICNGEITRWVGAIGRWAEIHFEKFV